MVSSQDQRQRLYRAAVNSISFGVVIGIALVVVLSVLFFHIANEVSEQEFFNFDKTVSLAIHATASDQQTAIMRIVTNFGSPYLLVLSVISLIIGGIIVARSQHMQRSGVVVAVIDMIAPTFAVAVATALSFLVKAIVERPRPNGIFFPQLVSETGPSFPSGHVLATVAFYGMCGYLLARPMRLLGKLGMTALVLAIIGAIAYSRVYLGVHYPSDTIGSLFLGSAWLFSLIIAINVMEKHLLGAHTLLRAQQQATPSTTPAVISATPLPAAMTAQPAATLSEQTTPRYPDRQGSATIVRAIGGTPSTQNDGAAQPSTEANVDSISITTEGGLSQ